MLRCHLSLECCPHTRRCWAWRTEPPHKTLAYKAGTADVLVDGKSSIAGERDDILQAVGGMACKYDELMAKKKDEGREFVK